MLTDNVGIPPEKILLGLPFYGREFNTTKLYGSSTGGGGIVYREIMNKINEGGWNYQWDDVSMAPYLTNDEKTKIIFYDTPESITLKCNYALQQKLRGVMIWALGGDYVNGEQPLLKAIGNTIKKTGN